MKRHLVNHTSPVADRLDGKLASYLAASGAVGLALASEANAQIVGNRIEQPFGINGDVNIDFNADGQVDFQIDHDRVDLNGTDIDYLQIDKNDVNSAANPIPIDAAATFDTMGTPGNNTVSSAYVVNGIDTGFGDNNNLGSYPAALQFGDLIGPGQVFDFQESDNFDNSGNTIRANRLIDEDMTQIDQDPGFGNNANVQVPFDGPNFVGLGGAVRYLGVQFNPQNAGNTHNGWIGIRIDNEDDATGAVTGWAYNTIPDAPIHAGVIPEPSSIILAFVGGVAILSGFCRRRILGK